VLCRGSFPVALLLLLLLLLWCYKFRCLYLYVIPDFEISRMKIMNATKLEFSYVIEITKYEKGMYKSS